MYQFASQVSDSETTPELPFRAMGSCLMFTEFRGDPNKCHLRWVRRFKSPTVCGAVKLSSSPKVLFKGMIRRNIKTLKQTCAKAFSPKLPKPGQRILIIGAGPSGLHMAHLLTQRGIKPGNITILEKSERYAGKTVSVLNKTTNRLNDPSFTPLSDENGGTACVKQCGQFCGAVTSTACTPCTTCCTKPETTLYDIKEIEQKTRDEIPNALAFKEDYFTGGPKIWHELGTCYLAPSYFAVRRLLRELQDESTRRVEAARSLGSQEELRKWTEIASIDITEEVAPDTYSIMTPAQSSMTLEEWVFRSGADDTTLENYCPCFQTGAVDLAILLAKRRYCKLWTDYLGGFYYTMPPRPQREHFDKIDMSFGQFLEENDLQILTPLFTYALTAQGYGIIAEAPTLFAMQWLSPDTLDGYFEWHAYFSRFKDSNGKLIKEIPENLKKLDNPRKGMLVNGFKGLWDRIIDLHDLGRPGDPVEKSIKYNVQIRSITRTDRERDAVRVEYTQVQPDKTRVEKIETYDYLIVAAPLSDPVVDPSTPTLNIDLNEREARYFLGQTMVAGQFRTTLFKTEPLHYLKDHLEIYLDKVLGPEAGRRLGIWSKGLVQGSATNPVY